MRKLTSPRSVYVVGKKKDKTSGDQKRLNKHAIRKPLEHEVIILTSCH